MTRGSTQVSVPVSPELLRAIDAEADACDLSRAGMIRRIVTDHLREAGQLALSEPPLHQLGAYNDRYRTGGRP